MDASVTFGRYCHTNYYSNVSLTVYGQKTSNLKGVRESAPLCIRSCLCKAFNLICSYPQ